MDSSRFDEFTKSLAKHTSRRQTLRGILGVLAGSLAATFLPEGAALASNSACAHFCASVFGADTAAADQCTSDAAHHKGLCYTCGPASSGGTKPICCPGGSGSCSSYSSATCCGNSSTCLNGSCCTNANICGSTCLAAPCDASQCMTCDSASGSCVSTCGANQTCQGGQCICVSPPPPPAGPDALQCTCKDGTQINLCVTVNCFSGAAQDVFCGPACQCHGGEQGTGCSSGGCGCFTGRTLIAMADGTSRPIEHVQIGNVVLGHEGRINRVVDIKQPLLGKRPLYALNEGSFFVTAGHPFLTTTGWKSIDPAATALENPAMVVERLAVGDRLLTLMGAAVPVGAARVDSAEAVDVHVEPVVLQSITSQPAGAATQLYNLQLDGNHTYFANGLLVHNK